MKRKSTIWTPNNIDFLVKNYANVSNNNLSCVLGISTTSIKCKARELGLKKECVKRKIFSNIENQVIQLSKDVSYRNIANQMNISLAAVHRIINKASEKGFQKRSPEQTGKLISQARHNIIKKERARAIFGFPPKSKLKVFPNKRKYRIRERMKRCRYEVDYNGIDAMVDEETRRHSKLEKEAKKAGFNIILPAITYYSLDDVSPNGEAEKQIVQEMGTFKFTHLF